MLSAVEAAEQAKELVDAAVSHKRAAADHRYQAKRNLKRLQKLIRICKEMHIPLEIDGAPPDAYLAVLKREAESFDNERTQPRDARPANPTRRAPDHARAV